MKNLRRVFYITLIIIALSMTFFSCRSRGGAEAAMKRIEDTKAEKAKEVQAQYDKALKRHMDIQTKKTRKQMKEVKKKSKEFNKQTKGK